MTKISWLYHASTDPNIVELTPREDSPRYPGEGPLIFATPCKSLAAAFLAPKDAGSVEICKFDDKVVVFVQNTAENYIAHDQSGAIYTLPAESFKTDNAIGMGTDEWVSDRPIKPLCKEVYRSSLEAMEQNGVQLYFIDEHMMHKIRTSPDHGLSLLHTLIPYA